MVKIVLPAASLTGVMQDRVASPSINTVQAPQSPAPQPNFVPTRPKFVAQRPQKGHLRLDINRDFPSIDDKKGHGPHASDPACCSAKLRRLKRTSEANCRTRAIKSARAANILPCTGPAQAG